MTSDEFRLLAISKVLDELGGIDLHARACELNGGNEAKDIHYLAAAPESGQINAAGQEESSEEAVVKPAQDAARTPAPAAPTPQGTPRTNESRKSAPCVGSSW